MSESLAPHGCRRLACAVILTAVQELRQRGRNGGVPYREAKRPEGMRREARRFLEGSGLVFWAEAAGMDPERIRVKVLTHTEGVVDDETG